MTFVHALRGRPELIIWSAFLILSIVGRLEAREASPKRLTDLTHEAESQTSEIRPVVEYAVHHRGNIELVVANNGTFGTSGSTIIDPLTGETAESCIYPKGSSIFSLWVAAVWIGAVVGHDTLVSTGSEDFYRSTEFWPETKPAGDIVYQSIDMANKFYSPQALSEEDIYCEYTDTIDDPGMSGQDPYDNRPHKPLGIKVTQRSMAWSYPYADDFILFDYRVENIGSEVMRDVYLGIWVDGDIWHTPSRNGPIGWTDDIAGFYQTHPAREGCGLIDSINVAWWADNDGDPVDGQFNDESATSIMGVRVVRTPSVELKYSFNWWTIDYGNASKDFGPRKVGDRDMGIRMGTPLGDANKYYLLRHEQFDYDLMYTAVNHYDPTQGAEAWLPPPPHATDVANGYDNRYLLSFGPFDVSPGQQLPISFAFVAGERFHRDPTAFARYFNEHNPEPYYEALDFSELAANSRWASWIYDNPGVDTDGDGYFGRERTCCLDTATVIDSVTDTLVHDTIEVYSKCKTSYYVGDGIPDFRGAAPPPAPVFWLEPSFGSIYVRFNGQRTETEVDNFSGLADFEGYRVYIGRDDRRDSYIVAASYDLEDYNKWVYDRSHLPEPKFVLVDAPYSLEELRCLYGDEQETGDPCTDENFDPLQYSLSSPYRHPEYPLDSIFYFEKQDYNQSVLGINTDIRKVFPHQPYPSSLDPDRAQPDELTSEGYLKYFEYEYTFDDLLPSVPYWINVTAFDFGSPEVGLAALESSVANDAKMAYPLTPTELVEAHDLDVYVYPNPYRTDGDYGGRAFENHSGGRNIDRSRLIHFANLPRICKIKIFSIDGDLVQSFEHNFPEGGPEAMHDTWDLISRNRQAVVSGLYFYTVESAERTQLGKFAIIK